MSRLDDALRESLRREDPGADFTRRVLARAAAARPAKRSWWAPPLVRWATAGALACAMLAAGLQYQHERRLQAQGEAAKQQLVLALRIAGTKLEMARAKVVDRNY